MIRGDRGIKDKEAEREGKKEHNTKKKKREEKQCPNENKRIVETMVGGTDEY